MFHQAFARGIGPYFNALAHPDAVAAIQLTLLVAAISVVLNLVFGLIAAWAIAKFEFRGKTLLITLIDLPFSISPGDLRSGVRPAVRRARLLRRLAAGARHQDHLRAARASCWPPCW